MRFYLHVFHFLLRGDLEGAFRVVDIWANLYPADVAPFDLSAQVYAGMGQTKKCIDALLAALARDPARPDFLLTLSKQYELIGDFKAAETHLKKYIELLPADERGPLGLGKLYVASGRWEEGMAAFLEAQALRPQDSSIKYWIAELMDRTGKFDQAGELLESAFETAASDWDRYSICSQLVEHYWLRGELAKALSWDCDRACVRKELGTTWLARPAEELVEFRNDNYEDYWLRMEQGADENLLTALEARRADIDTRQPILAERLDLPLAGYLISMGRLEDAALRLEMYEDSEYLKVTGHVFVPIFSRMRGLLAEAQGNLDSAVTHHRAAAEGAPGKPRFAVALARVLRKLGQNDEALAELEGVLERYPAHPDAHHELAILSLDAGKAVTARTHLESAFLAWANADSTFAPAMAARQLEVELGTVP